MRTDDSVHQFMEVLIDFEGEKWCSKESGWNKQLANAVKAELRDELGPKILKEYFRT